MNGSETQLEIAKSRRKEENKIERLRLEYLAAFRESQAYKDYFSVISSLQAECEKIGHEPGDYEDNGLGWRWIRCKWCDKRYNMEPYG